MTGIMHSSEASVPSDVKAQSKKSTSIIVPAFNEENGLSITLENIYRSVDGLCEVLVIDDGSDDATSEVASRFPCRLIRHKKNLGKGEALKTGMRHASGKYVIFIDADDTYPADTIPKMYEALESCDVVYGSRVIGRNNIPPVNRLGNAIFQRMMRLIYGFKAADYSTGLYGIRKHCLEMMRISSSGFSVEPEIAIKASRMGLRVRDIPVEYRARVGQAKLRCFDAGFGHLRTIVSFLFWRPPRSEP